MYLFLPNKIVLPSPFTCSKISVEEAIFRRTSTRSYSWRLTVEEISQVLWAAYGTVNKNKKTVPSAGAKYPLNIYVVFGEVVGQGASVYKYDAGNNCLDLKISGDVRAFLSKQKPVVEAPASIVISASLTNINKKYGSRSKRFCYLEAGHCSQNIYLQAYSLGLGTVAIGSFSDRNVKSKLQMALDEIPIYIMPIGRNNPKSRHKAAN